MQENTKKSFYITTTLPYVNSDPHVGFAMEIVRADTIARFKKVQGYHVFFNTGTDEHGQKLFEAAQKEGKDVKEYVDFYAEKFRDLKQLLNISEDVHFIRTTDEHHVLAAQEFWRLCKQNGFIYKKNYQTKYCVGCELYKTDSELNESGQCPIHPKNQIELVDEENYFFRFSNFQKPLLNMYAQNPTFVVPDFRFNEIKSFVEAGLEDFSISRLKKNMSWGVPVPDDDEHVMYVWFDALVNYVSTLGWPEDVQSFKNFWESGTPVQYCGKDNLRQQSAMWQAMLMAAGLPNSYKIIINGFITGEGGIKMSKSIGNVVNPIDLVNEYGAEALRYFLLRELSSFEDSPFSRDRFKEAYNASLANGLGNLASRILTLSEKYLDKCPEIPETTDFTEYFALYETFDFKKVMDYIWGEVESLDKFIQETEPFKVIKVDEVKGKELITTMVLRLYQIARMLNPVMPETNEKLKKLIKANKKPETPLFARKD